MDIETDRQRGVFVLALVETCVRNTYLEALHAGTFPQSHTGDYQDVKVVTPDGEIPWRSLSRISNEEMKTLMIEVVNRVFTFLSAPEDLILLGSASRWNKPRHDLPLWRSVQRRALVRRGMTMDAALEAIPPAPDGSVEPVSEEQFSAAPQPDAGDLRKLADEAEPDLAWIRRARIALREAADLIDYHQFRD